MANSREQELLERIRQLEEQNSALQDKLDMIWAILAPDYDEGDDPEVAEDGEPSNPKLVHIDGFSGKKP